MSGSGKGGSTTIGYRYLMSIHMGLCRGTIDEMVHIRVGDRTAWTGSVGGRSITTFPIDAYQIFGGDKREGGIQGTLHYLPGNPDQPVYGPLVSLLGGIVPAFRGITSLLFDGIICALNPYPKEWKMRLRRTTSGWMNDNPWYPERCLVLMANNFIDLTAEITIPNSYYHLADPIYTGTTYVLGGDSGSESIPVDHYVPSQYTVAQQNDLINNYIATQAYNLVTIKAMNPAHILYELATNRTWSRGFDVSLIDDASYRYAADVLASEDFGLCMKWSRTDTVANMIKMVLDHIGAVQYVDRYTGLLTLKLIRSDYDPNQLPLFTPTSGLIEITQDDSGAVDLATNEIIVKWHDPVTDQDAQVREQNLASIQLQGSVSSETHEYLGIPTRELAHRVALRDLRISASGLRRYKIKFDRSARKITPAGVFRISDPSRGIVNLILRAGEYDDGTLADGTISITAVQDVFGLPATGFTADQPTTWVKPDTSARPVTDAAIVETTYRTLVRNLGASDAAAKPVTSCFIGTIAHEPSSLALGYTLKTEPDGATAYATVNNGSWCPSLTINSALTRDPSSVSLVFSNAYELYLVTTPCAALLDNEIVRVDALDLTNNIVSITRGCVDTEPQVHAAASRLSFYDTGAVADATEYAPVETVRAKLITRTTSATLADTSAPILSYTTVQRQGRPYPPGSVRVAGQPGHLQFPINQQQDVAITWAHRDRIQQQDQIVGHTAGSIGPETGVSYVAVIYAQNGTTILNTYAVGSGTAWTYTYAMQQNDNALVQFSIYLYSVRGGLRSLYPFIMQSAVAPTGLGYQLGNSLGS